MSFGCWSNVTRNKYRYKILTWQLELCLISPTHDNLSLSMSHVTVRQWMRHTMFPRYSMQKKQSFDVTAALPFSLR